MSADDVQVPDGDGVDVDTIRTIVDEILERHSEGAPVELMLHYDESYEQGVTCLACENGEGHMMPVCNGCYPVYDDMPGHAVWPCKEAKSATAIRAALASQPALSGVAVAEAVAAYRLGVRHAQQVVAGEDTIEWARNADRSISWLIEGMDDLLDDVDEIADRIAREGVTG